MPVLLFQVTQPMNDVVVTAVWMAVLAASLAAEPHDRGCWVDSRVGDFDSPQPRTSIARGGSVVDGRGWSR